MYQIFSLLSLVKNSHWKKMSYFHPDISQQVLSRIRFRDVFLKFCWAFGYFKQTKLMWVTFWRKSHWVCKTLSISYSQEFLWKYFYTYLQDFKDTSYALNWNFLFIKVYQSLHLPEICLKLLKIIFGKHFGSCCHMVHKNRS